MDTGSSCGKRVERARGCDSNHVKHTLHVLFSTSLSLRVIGAAEAVLVDSVSVAGRVADVASERRAE